MGLGTMSSSWLLNRYHRHAAIGSTPYESVIGRPYLGKIAPFGEYVFAPKKPEKKGTANWIGGIPGIYLGKNAQDFAFGRSGRWSIGHRISTKDCY